MRAALAATVLAGLMLTPAASARPLDKLDARLHELATGKRSTANPSVKPVGGIVRDGKVLVDVYVRGGMRSGAAALRDEGMRVEAISARSPQRVVEGWVPVSNLDDVAALPSTRAVVTVPEPVYNAGSATSEGDARHNAPAVRAQGFTGAGIPVGVMSDTINKRGTGVAGGQASGDLPATVQILVEPASGTDEGRAMAEIVFDEAPGIPRIIFATGGGGPAARAANIDALVNAGAKVIADDTVYLSEPFFQDGIVAQAADRAKADGTAYFVSAGNRARQSWEGTFTPSSSVPAENDFVPGPGEDRRQTIATVPDTQQLSLFVQWANPFGAVTDDFALDFYNANTAAFIGTVNNDNVTSGVPAESAVLTGAAGGTAFAMTIRRISGSGTPRLKWIANGAFTGALPAEHSVNAQAIDPDAASARGTLAVAAVRQNDAGLDTVESFSSRGPTVTRFFSPTGAPLATPDVRAKPDIAAADGVATTVDGPPVDLNPFFGTSAAAPSAAGVGALLLSAKPSLPVDELYAIMRDPRGAIDCTSAAGFPDGDCGSGFVLADGKLAMVLDSTPPSVTPAISPAAPDGSNGWFHSPVSLTWRVADAESPVGRQAGCGPRSVTGQGAVAFTCSATSAGGTTNRPIAVKRDSVPPGPPGFTGIADGDRVTRLSVPSRRSIACTASDATSGVASCVVAGLRTAVGRHRLTATATDESGLTSTSTLTYTVRRATIAVTRKQTIRSVLRKGFRAAVRLGRNRTTLDARLNVGRTRCGRLRTTRNRGRARLRIKAGRACRRKLRRARRAKFALTLRASGPNISTVTLKKSVRLRRR